MTRRRDNPFDFVAAASVTGFDAIENRFDAMELQAEPALRQQPAVDPALTFEVLEIGWSVAHLRPRSRVELSRPFGYCNHLVGTDAPLPDAVVEHVARGKLFHLDQPVDDLPLLIENELTVNIATKGNQPTIGAAREPPVEQQHGRAIVLLSFQGRECQSAFKRGSDVNQHRRRTPALAERNALIAFSNLEKERGQDRRR